MTPRPGRLVDELVAAARLDLAEVWRSRWLLFATAVYGLLAVVFVLVGLRESAVLGFTGLGRVLLSFAHALLLLLPLLALSATGPLVPRARDEGMLEFLLSQPIRRTAWFSAVSLVRLLALAVPLGALMLAMAAYGALALAADIPWAFLGRTLLVSAALLVAFVGLGMAISARSRQQARAAVAVVVAWLAAVALLDFGLLSLMLTWRVHPRVVFLLGALNPVEAARLALLSGIEPDLGSLGPVGFYLANRVGSRWLLLVGTAWPAALGLLAWWAALRGFRRGDVV